MESDTTLKSGLSLKMAMPSLSLYPPGSIKLAAKDTVAINSNKFPQNPHAD